MKQIGSELTTPKGSSRYSSRSAFFQSLVKDLELKICEFIENADGNVFLKTIAIVKL